MTIRQISKNLNTDYKNTFQAIASISNLISREKFGNTNMIKIRYFLDQMETSLEFYELEEIVYNKKDVEKIEW